MPTVSYDSHLIASAVVRLLSNQPALRLTAMSRSLGVDRHTITRALDREFSLDFKGLRHRMRVESIETAAANERICSLKGLAVSMGFGSSRAASHWSERNLGGTLRQVRNRAAGKPK